MTCCKLLHDDLACYGNTSAAAKGGDEMQPPGSGIPRGHTQPPHVVHRAPRQPSLWVSSSIEWRTCTTAPAMRKPDPERTGWMLVADI
jgi:hypothetical protein